MGKSIQWAVPPPPPEQPAVSGLDYEALQKCIHCGFCTQACPTYRQTGLETASPRGRLSLMRAVAEGQLPVDEDLADLLDLCLGCRACESACPSGVPYGQLLEEARDLTAPVKPAPWYVRLGMRHLLPYPARLRWAGRLARAAQRLGLFRLLPAGLRDLAQALPEIHAPRPYDLGKSSLAPTVLFFRGCVQEAFLQPQNQAAVRVIQAAGFQVAVPEGQTCCGALHAHYGDREQARELARRNIAAFEQVQGPIINHAGGCGAHLKQYDRLLEDDPQWAERARAFVTRVKDLSEWLWDVGLPPGILGELPLTVTYQDSCHLVHGQKIRQQPRRLIRSIPGVTYQEMAAADQCCGSAGIYNVLQPQMADKVLDEKMGSVQDADAAVLVTANPGCYMQLRKGVQDHGLHQKMQVVSLAELLDRALESKPKP